MRRYFSLAVAASILAACAAPSVRSVPTLPSARFARSTVGGEFLYAASANAGVSVYHLGNTVPVRTLSANLPTALAFDRSGNLYVANRKGGPSGRGSVSIFGPGSTSPKRKITNGINAPYSLALDSKGNLYVANYVRAPNAPKFSKGSVTVYRPSADTPYRTITGVDEPHQLIVDSRDDLIVAGRGYLQVYAPGAKSPTRMAIRYPLGIAIDSKDRIYAGVWEGCPNYCYGGIAVFVPGKTKAVAGFNFDGSEAPATDVTGLAFDSLGDFIFSATNGPRYPFEGPPQVGGGATVENGAVGVYPTLRHHEGRHRYWITTSYNLAPSAVLVDPGDNIIVGSNGSVVAFPDFKPNAPPLYTITQGISGQVTALAIASQ